MTTPAITPDTRPRLIGMTPDEMSAALAALGEQPFRGKQIARWLYEARVSDFDAMTDLAKPLREKLKVACVLRTATIAAKESDFENTTKLALRFPDGSIIESVLMFEGQRTRNGDDGELDMDELDRPSTETSERRTLCVSTQAGCAMGCRFCASGQLGLKRHLTISEILEQFYATADALPKGQWLTNVVYMGMGEPLHNWEGFTGSLRALTSPWGFGMSPRRVTVSTVGLAPRILDLAKLDIAVNLAISLHAPNDEIRSKLIPTNKAYGGIEGIVTAAQQYFNETRRQVTFEYTLVGGENDRAEHARELVRLVAKKLPGCNVNLIPMNPVEGSGLETPGAEDVRIFAKILSEAGLSVHTRKKKGRQVSGACGQLRLRVEQGKA